MKINATVVGAKLKELNKTKSAGPDGIHPRILWETRDSITKRLSNIFESPWSAEKWWVIGQQVMWCLFIKKATNLRWRITGQFC